MDGGGSLLTIYLDALRSPEETITVELRPPAAGLSGPDSMDAWIDTYHGVRKLVRAGHFIFLTDNAVGAAEEENLSHLSANLAGEVNPERVIPFLTCKHSLDYCLMYAERAWAQGFRNLVVLGGDKHVGPPRCVPHAFQLRQLIRERMPGLVLGGWVNPHADPVEQAAYLADPEFTGEFWLSQVVSHHAMDRVEGLLAEVERQRVTAPGVFGVFYYRSGNPKTLQRLSEFFPVPVEGLTKEFEEGASPEEVCGRTVEGLRGRGVGNVYLSNLPLRRATALIEDVLASSRPEA